MVIDHNRKFIFIHTPRTGGFSAYKFFKECGLKKEHNHKPRRKIEYPDYFSFGFLRNPWSRLYSCFREIEFNWNKYHNERNRFVKKGFKYFLLEARHPLKAPGMYFVEGCSYIAKYEDFQTEWNYIFDKINISRVIIPHGHGRGCSEYKNQYDNEMIDFVYDHSDQDIKHFNYTFE